jgi:hypothetical protein
MLTDHHRSFVDVPPAIAKRRLIERHIFAGIEKIRDVAAARVEENDIENGNLIRKIAKARYNDSQLTSSSRNTVHLCLKVNVLDCIRANQTH